MHPHEGLLSLLQSGFIHSTNYHSLGLHVRRLSLKPLKSKQAEESKLMEIRQTVNLVFGRKIVSSGRDWSVRKMFGQGLNGASAVAASSKIYVDISEESFRLPPHPTRVISSQRGSITTQLAVYNVKAEFPHQMFSIAATLCEEISSWHRTRTRTWQNRYENHQHSLDTVECDNARESAVVCASVFAHTSY